MRYPVPKEPGRYNIISALSAAYIRSIPPGQQRDTEIIDSIRVMRVDFAVVDDERQLCVMQHGGPVPITLHIRKKTIWGPRVPDWDPEMDTDTDTDTDTKSIRYNGCGKCSECGDTVAICDLKNGTCHWCLAKIGEKDEN